MQVDTRVDPILVPGLWSVFFHMVCKCTFMLLGEIWTPALSTPIPWSHGVTYHVCTVNYISLCPLHQSNGASAANFFNIGLSVWHDRYQPTYRHKKVAWLLLLYWQWLWKDVLLKLVINTEIKDIWWHKAAGRIVFCLSMSCHTLLYCSHNGTKAYCSTIFLPLWFRLPAFTCRAKLLHAWNG